MASTIKVMSSSDKFIWLCGVASAVLALIGSVAAVAQEMSIAKVLLFSAAACAVLMLGAIARQIWRS